MIALQGLLFTTWFLTCLFSGIAVFSLVAAWVVLKFDLINTGDK